MDLQEMIDNRDEIIIRLNQLNGEQLEIVRKIAHNLAIDNKGGISISTLLQMGSAQWHRDAIRRLAGRLKDHRKLITTYNFICRYYAQEPGA